MADAKVRVRNVNRYEQSCLSRLPLSTTPLSPALFGAGRHEDTVLGVRTFTFLQGVEREMLVRLEDQALTGLVIDGLFARIVTLCSVRPVPKRGEEDCGLTLEP